MKLDDLCRNEDLRANLVNSNQWNVESLTSMTAYGITPDTIATYYKFAKFNFDCGDYQQGRDMLENYISLHASPPKQRKDGEGGNNAPSGEEDKTGNPSMYYLTSIDTALLQVLWGKLSRDLVKVMQQCEYSDPIVEFVDKLSVKFDFEAAQLQLARCETVLSSDFFLCKQTELFMEEARVFVFENYCRIHHKIDLTTLGEKLAMDRERAERWIVDLIRNALLDAKIDSEEGCVVMGTGSTTVYEQVMDKTKELTARSGGLVANLRGYMNDVKREKIRKEREAKAEY